MHRHTQGQAGYGAKAGGVTDWQALEVQLNRTRVMLQEILGHLQEVLKNLRSGRTGGPTASARAGAEQTRGPGPRDSRFRAQATPPPGASDRFSRTQAHNAAGASASAGASERARYKARPHFEAKGPSAGPAGHGPSAGTAHQRASGNGQNAGSASQRTSGSGQNAGNAQQRTTGFGQAAGEDRTRAGQAGTGRAGQTNFRAGGGFAGAQRERPRQESTFRSRAAGPEASAGAAGQQSRASAGAGQGASQGAYRASAQGQAAGASRPHARPRPERPAGGFCHDDDRQHRAREVARKNGMNLKCAYDILCINYPCTVDEIKNAYRHMARRHHPDLGGDEEAMKDVNVAYELAMRFSAGRRTATAWAV